ncbi:MAG: dihydrofolate reductase [Acidobacteria bacterium]|nr:dihydrofolate reductase [Acidobacteriota bacterium]
MRLSIIAAVSANRVIGHHGSLPWKLPDDWKRFQKLTMGHHLLMGRKTFESIGFVLPGRTTVVITHQSDYHPEGVLVAHSLEEALRLVKNDSELFIAGGAEIYRPMLPLADRLYLTCVHENFEGDIRFPDFDESDWELVSREDREPDPDHTYSFSFVVYDRKPPATP